MDELAQKGRLTPHERALYGWLSEAEKALEMERAQVREWQQLYDRAMTQLNEQTDRRIRWQNLAVSLREWRELALQIGKPFVKADLLDRIREAEDELGLS